MIEYIAHRINTKSELEALDSCFGLELDLRDSLDGRVYMQHDPFIVGEDFEEFLKSYKHGTLILNVKSERIEFKILELLKKYGVTNYFFLDSSFPMIKTLSDRGESKVALRFSEFEGMDTLESMKGKVDWIWVDCFTKFPLTKPLEEKLHNLGYKICIVSPELQSQPEKIAVYKNIIKESKIKVDAICTKFYNIALWQE